VMTFNTTEEKAIINCLTKLNDENVKYVLLRGFKPLAESASGSDIDILIDGSDLDQVGEIVADFGFSSYTGITHFKYYQSIVSKTIKYPTEAIKKIKTEPDTVINLLSGPNRSTTSLRNTYDELKFERDNAVLHFFNHLAYDSPMFDTKVRVHPSVEEGMLQRRQLTSGYAIPSAPDELAHLICRGVFDKDGNFPEHYKQRCDTIWENIKTEEQQLKILKVLFSDIFYNADTAVINCIRNKAYDSIRSDLLQFRDY
jgi:hypothetical protein